MWIYWLMFVLPAWAAIKEPALVRQPGNSTAGRVPIPRAWWITAACLTLLIGWRQEVGADWFSYLDNFASVPYASQIPDWWWNDPGYRCFEWIAFQLGWGIHGVNLMAGALLSIGLIIFCRHLPRPWLALAVSIPYLVIILGMGYSRQAAALGCLMAGLAALGSGKVLRFVTLALLGAVFHKSAVLLLPMAALATSRRRWTTAIWVVVIAAGAYRLFLQESVDSLRSGYLEAEYQSEGALVRLLMTALPAALLLWKRKRFAVSIPQQRLWFWFSLASFALLGWYFVSPSSTAVDRVALYLLPLQLMVFAYLPEVLGSSVRSNRGWVLAVVAYYALVEFVWLNFAIHAKYWVPYRWYPLEWFFS